MLDHLIHEKTIKASVLLGIFMWIVDGILDYYFFYPEGTLIGLTFTDIPPHELYVRLLWLVGLVIFGLFASRIIEDREQALKDKKDLESMLRAVRNVNQLLVRENDRKDLIQGTCRELIDSREYEHVWILLLKESKKLVSAAQRGMGNKFGKLLERIEAAQLPDCLEEALNQSRIVTVKDPSEDCTSCPLADTYGDHAAVIMRLEYGENVYGLLGASVPAHLLQDEEELGLFKEATEDIAFGLHDIQVEERRKQALQQLSHQKRLLARTQKLAKVGGWEYDLKEDQLRWTDQVYEIYGVDQKEYDPNDIREDIDFYSPEDRKAVEEAFNKAITEGELTTWRPSSTLRTGKTVGSARSGSQ